MNAILIRGVLVGALAGLLFGFDTAVIAGTTAGLRDTFQLSPGGLGITVSSALWGTLVGALLAGIPGDRFGARQGLKGVAIFYIVSSLGCVVATEWSQLLAFRFITGLAIGASSVLAPVYIAEVAPPAKRGALVGAFQFNIVLGILVAYLSNYLIDTMDLGAAEWRWKFGVAAVPALILFAMLFTIPQSPRWLALKGRRDEARAVLRQIAPDEAQQEEAAILAETAVSPEARLSWSRHRKPMLLAAGVAFFNQMSGINAILYYINDIFAAAGYSSVSAGQQTIVVGAVNLLFTMLALGVIDKAGRKTLLLIGAVGTALALAGTAAIMFTGLHRELLLWMLIGFIAAFAFSQGAVIWVYIAEVFPTEVRARGQSLGSSTHWGMNAIIAYLFPVIAAYSAGAPFVFFAVMSVVQFFFVWAWFPETKRVSLEEMTARIG